MHQFHWYKWGQVRGLLMSWGSLLGKQDSVSVRKTHSHYFSGHHEHGKQSECDLFQGRDPQRQLPAAGWAYAMSRHLLLNLHVNRLF